MLYIIQAPAHRGDLEMRMAIDHARHDRRLAQIFDIDPRKLLSDLVPRPNCRDLSAVDRDRTIRYWLGRDRQNMIGSDDLHWTIRTKLRRNRKSEVSGHLLIFSSYCVERLDAERHLGADELRMGRRWDVGDRSFEWECWGAMGLCYNWTAAAACDSFLYPFYDCRWGSFLLSLTLFFTVASPLKHCRCPP
ncbi:MAG: hypothetical protein IPK01_03400 [Acidobacteria bacterium]|nr:hypothetical protein [Acidobacteriota bacterium]